MARNRERVGAQNIKNDPPPQALGSNEAVPFSFVVPTEFVELPSEGRYYPEGHPLHNQETIEIKHMTAREEDLLTSRALLKKGIALERLLDSVIINKNIRAADLLVGDRNAILVAARISGYGPDYKTKVTCPACGTVQSSVFNLNNLNSFYGTGYSDQEAVHQGNGIFTTTLPRTKVEVTYKLLRGNDERNLMNKLENQKKAKKEESLVTDQLRQIIVAVNGATDQASINYLVDNIPSIDASHLRFTAKLTTPNVDMAQDFECQACDFEQELEVPLTADFFWPDR
mgnify:CR=1 FL=1